MVIPQILIKYLLHSSNDSLGHVGATKLYQFLKRLHYFQGMRKKIHQYVRSWHKCQIMITQKPTLLTCIKISQNFHRIPYPIDLLGPYSVTSQGNSYTLTAVCNLTGYLKKTPIKDKKTMTAVTHLFSDIMLKFRFPRILHSDNGIEFHYN